MRIALLPALGALCISLAFPGFAVAAEKKYPGPCKVQRNALGRIAWLTHYTYRDDVVRELHSYIDNPDDLFSPIVYKKERVDAATWHVSVERGPVYGTASWRWEQRRDADRDLDEARVFLLSSGNPEAEYIRIRFRVSERAVMLIERDTLTKAQVRQLDYSFPNGSVWRLRCLENAAGYRSFRIYRRDASPLYRGGESLEDRYPQVPSLCELRESTYIGWDRHLETDSYVLGGMGQSGGPAVEALWHGLSAFSAASADTMNARLALIDLLKSLNSFRRNFVRDVHRDTRLNQEGNPLEEIAYVFDPRLQIYYGKKEGEAERPLVVETTYWRRYDAHRNPTYVTLSRRVGSGSEEELYTDTYDYSCWD